MSNYNGLSDAETERLAILVEELGEALQAAGKILRHGYESEYTRTHQLPPNRDKLELELGCVRAAIIRMCMAGDLNKEAVHFHAAQKLTSQAYLHHQG